MTDSVRAEREEVFRVPREALWALLTDTERLNREIGLPPVRFSFTPQNGGGSTLRGEIQVRGVTLRFREEPYRWVRPQVWSVRRIFEKGPLAEYDLGMRLEEGAGGEIRVAAFAEVAPRGVLTRPMARLLARGTVNSLLAMGRQFEAFLLGHAASAYSRHGGKPAANRELLLRHIAGLKRRGVRPQIAERLGAHLADAPIEDVVNFRPFVVADRWGVEREEVLRACLAAVREEILEMRWRVLCPSCRGAGEGMAHLGEMASGEAHCPSCDIRFGPEFDRSVEVCFSVAPTIRPSEPGEATYCIGGPGNAPHVAAQWALAPGEEQSLIFSLTPGRYTLRSPQAAEPVTVAVRDDAAGTAEVTLDADGGRTRIALPGETLPASGSWRLRNRTGAPAVLRLETPGWMADAATAAQVTSLQAFRDQFSSEVLSPGVELSVRQIAILFSDLKGSTNLYQSRGDAPSYAVVRDHFAFLREVLGRHGGGIVKTIGDAVMAAFPDPADALAAAIEAQRLAPRRADPLVIKLGMHAGPALAVNANDLLDYFGQTVNMAARIGAQSIGGDVVLAAALMADRRITSQLESVRHELFRTTLRGTGEPTHLVRLWPNEPAQRNE